MTIKLSKWIGLILLTGLMASANAASIVLSPTSNITNISVGDTVAFDIVMDFSGDTNGLGSDITLGGGFDILYDSSALELTGLSNAVLGDPSFSRDPETLPGVLRDWHFFDFDGLTGPALVGSVQFLVLPTVGASTFVETGPAAGDPFVSGVDFVTLLDVDYDVVEVTIASGTDTDNDGVSDDVDNCTLVANPLQRDTDGDGFGNFCDGDFDQNGMVNFSDLSMMRAGFFGTDPDLDMNGDTFVNFQDLNLLRAGFFGPPGPAAQV